MKMNMSRTAALGLVLAAGFGSGPAICFRMKSRTATLPSARMSKRRSYSVSR